MKMDSEYFAKGFLDKMSTIMDLEKVAYSDDVMPLGDKMQDKFSEAIANALAFSAVKSIGGILGTMKQSLTQHRLGPLQKRFIEDLIKRDPTLNGRDKDRVISHYTTLANLAPSIARDPNVVLSFLKQSTAYDTIDTVMIKTLIDIESGYRQRDNTSLDVLSKYTKKGAR